jgi:hypothetical protein
VLWHLQLHKLLVHLPCPPEAHSTEFAASIEACDPGDSPSKTTPRFLKNLPTNLADLPSPCVVYSHDSHLSLPNRWESVFRAPFFSFKSVSLQTTAPSIRNLPVANQ